MFGYSRTQQEVIMQEIASLQVVPKTVQIISVTTRAVGFMCQFLFCKFARLCINIPLGSSIYQLYRILLLQFEIKVDQAMREQCSHYTGGKSYRRLDISVEHIRTVSVLGAHFAPLANLINAVGIIKNFGAVYLPRMSSNLDVHSVEKLEPVHVTFSNLRSIVSFLANPDTNQVARMYFYQHSPLPGAIWGSAQRLNGVTGVMEEIPGSYPLLLNPDDFMPADYMQKNLYEDIALVQDLLGIVGRKYPKYVHLGPIDFSSSGNVSGLVNNRVETLRCANLPVQEIDGRRRIDYQGKEWFAGNLSSFWSPEHLSESEFFVGVHHLLGELPEIPSEAYVKRHNSVAKQKAKMNFIVIYNNL